MWWKPPQGKIQGAYHRAGPASAPTSFFHFFSILTLAILANFSAVFWTCSFLNMTLCTSVSLSWKPFFQILQSCLISFWFGFHLVREAWPPHHVSNSTLLPLIYKIPLFFFVAFIPDIMYLFVVFFLWECKFCGAGDFLFCPQYLFLTHLI
jgi:hypothetical protein